MDDLKQTLEKLRDELASAGKRLADLAEKGKAELPGAAKKDRRGIQADAEAA